MRSEGLNSFTPQNEGVGTSTTILDGGGSPGYIEVPGGAFFLTADYSRIGDDLYLEGALGNAIVIKDYFTNADLPTLRTSGGAQLTPDIIEHLIADPSLGQ